MDTESLVKHRPTLRVLVMAIYATGVLVAYVYLMVHDWREVSGGTLIWMFFFNWFRALLWPVYLTAALFFFNGLLPSGRA
jgi:hypothetical protein